MATTDEIIRLILEAYGQDDIEALSGSLKELEKTAEGGGDAATKLAAELDRLATANKAAGAFVALKASVADTEDQLAAAKKRLEELNATYDENDKQTRKVAGEFKKAEAEVSRLEKSLNRQNLELQRTGGALAKAGVDVTKLGAEERRLRDEAAKAAEALGKHGQAATAAGEASKRSAGALNEMGNAFASASAKIGDIGAKLTAAGAAAAAAAAAFAVYKGGQFFSDAVKESAIAEVGAVTGSTAAELEILRAAAKRAALETGAGFVDVTKTLGELARAVGDATTAAEILGPTLDLAAVGAMESSRAAQILTTTLTQFGKEAGEATRVADLLAQAANSTTTDVSELGNALSYSAPLARQLGMTMEETVAAIGAMADEGFRGSRAGMALRQVMSQLNDDSSTFSLALDAMGIKTRNFNEVMKELGQRGEESKKAILSLDAAARPAILALVASGAQGIDKLSTAFANMEVTAADAARTMLATTVAATDRMKRSWEDLRMQLVEPLLAPIQREMDDLAKAMQAFANSPEFDKIKNALERTFEAGTTAMHTMVEAVDWGELADKIAAFAENSGKSIEEFAGNVRQHIATLQEIFNAFGIVIDSVQTAVFALAAAVAKVVQSMSWLDEMRLKMWDAIPGVNALAEKIGVDLTGAISDAETRTGALGAVFDEFADRAGKNFDELRGGLDEVGTHMEAAAATAAKTGDDIAEGLTAGGEGAENLIVMLQEVDGEIQFLGDSAQGTGDKIAKALAPAKVEAEDLARAFQTLRLTSQAELDAAAAHSKAAFETIEQAARDGSATVDDTRRAFEAYARAQLAAAANMEESARQQVEAMLRIKGNAIGATDALQRLGLVGVDAPDRIKPPADRAATSLHGLADAADRAGESVTGLGESADGAGEALDRMTASAESYTISLGKVSEATAQQFRDMAKSRHAYTSYSRHGTTAMSLLIKEVNNERDALREANKALDEHIQKYDPLTERLVRLRREYQHMTDEDLLALARKQEQLEKLEQQSRAQQGVTTAEQGTNYAYAEGNRLLDEQLKKQAELDQERERNTRRSEITVNFVAKAAKVEFDPSALTDAHWRQIASKVIEMIKRDMT